MVKEAVHDMVHRAIRLDGTCTGERHSGDMIRQLTITGEHGVGIGKVEYLDEELGRGTVSLMETVKRTREWTDCPGECDL